MLIVAFSLLSSGYYLSGQMSAYGAVFLSLLVMATGAGLFKPIISGTIARTTDETNSGFGFGIYYWMINLGAFLAPLVVSYLKGFSWSYVFSASALYCALMLLRHCSCTGTRPSRRTRRDWARYSARPRWCWATHVSC